ncbi:MAG TPA: monofunctional biosynthetic peptidoglycan transglycosylase [Terriglobia bacterium]|nr:monofunctional biosynthetic peptidoglycan transglycosylase [Terriglobia bacterium]
MKKKVVVAFGIFALSLIAYIAWVIVTLPDVEALAHTNPKTTALMEQRAEENHTKLQPLRAWVPYKQISVYLRNAVLVSEDSAFFQHAGFDWTQIKESAKKDWDEKRLARGASTITQQLAKNLYLSTSRNPLRKVEEIFIARELEQHLRKERILEIYLNVIEWGDGVYGVESASSRYFGKSPKDLLPEEAAVLAAMIPNPRRLTPSLNRAYLEKRKGEILDHMVRWHYLDRDDYDDARKRTVTYRQASPGR